MEYGGLSAKAEARVFLDAAGRGSSRTGATTKRGGKTTGRQTTARKGTAKSKKAQVRSHIRQSSGAGEAKSRPPRRSAT